MSRPSPPRLPRPPSPGSSDWAPDAASDPDPERRWSGDLTPLPAPLPHHVADPTRTSVRGLLDDDPGDPAERGAPSAPAVEREDVSTQLETRRLPRITDQDLAKLSGLWHGELPDDASEPSAPRALSAPEAGGAEAVSEEEPTLPPRLGAVPYAPAASAASAIDDDRTEPRELPIGTRTASSAPPSLATDPLRSALLAPVPPRDRPSVLQRFRPRRAAIGTTVIRRGETGHGLVLVVRGRLDQHTEAHDGARVSLGEVGPGDFVGEVSLLARSPAPAYVVATADCELLVLSASELYELLEAYPALATELAEVAARRARAHARLVES